MKISATFNVSFRILDQDLFNTLDSDEDAWVRFLTAIMDSVRYSEDWTKRLVSTEGDELYWDEDEQYGEAQVDITIEIDFENDLSWYTNWVSDLKDTWEVDVPTNPTLFNSESFLRLVSPAQEEPYRNAGPFWSIVRWGTMIPEYNDGDGCFLEYESEDQDLYLKGIRNLHNRMYFSFGEFVDAEGNMFDVTGDSDPANYEVQPS